MSGPVAARYRALTGYLVAGAAALTVFVAGSGQAQRVALAAATTLAMVGALAGVRRWTHDRRFGLTMAAGMALLSVENVRRVLMHMGHASTGDGVSAALDALAYLCVLCSGMLIVLRHAPRDRGGVIDASLIGIAGAGPVWEFLLRPRLQAMGGTAGSQFLLVETVVLLAYVGALGRISATTGRARPSLRALYLAQAAALVSFVASILTTEKATGERAGWITLVWICCYLSLGAAFLHPQSDSLATPERYREPTLSFRKLAALGVVLTIVPLSGCAPQLVGRPADGALVAVGTVVTIPLVLLRIGQLIEQRAADQRALAKLAAHDDLTGLPNRRTMMTLLDRALSEPTGVQVTVLYCDLDGFKPVNDTFGHRAGDEVLRTVARRLQHCVRSGDAVGRLGGDEFLVICQGLTDDEVTALWRRIEQVTAEPIAWEGRQITVGVTVGRASHASGPADRTDLDALIAEADQSMYAGKRARPAADRQMLTSVDVAVCDL